MRRATVSCISTTASGSASASEATRRVCVPELVLAQQPARRQVVRELGVGHLRRPDLFNRMELGAPIPGWEILGEQPWRAGM